MLQVKRNRYQTPVLEERKTRSPYITLPSHLSFEIWFYKTVLKSFQYNFFRGIQFKPHSNGVLRLLFLHFAELVQNLIGTKQFVRAVRFICGYKLASFRPVQILNEYLRDARNATVKAIIQDNTGQEDVRAAMVSSLFSRNPQKDEHWVILPSTGPKRWERNRVLFSLFFC